MRLSFLATTRGGPFFALLLVGLSSITITQSQEMCTQNSLRLVGGMDQYEGRVEVCQNGAWGTVCDDEWDAMDAAVVCRQLGYPTRDAMAFITARFGQGTGTIFFDDVMCVGTETTLASCPRSPSPADCSHSEDAGVRCLQCFGNTVRLVGGISPFEGRVELCSSGIWGTVCDDNWGVPDATVVCRQLGFPTEGAIAVLFGIFGRGTGPIVRDEVNCNGMENELAFCPALIGSGDCSHDEDAGVRCTERMCPELSAPDNGGLTVSSRTAGSVATYSCNVGYTLDGSAIRTCGTSGSWSGGNPVCILGPSLPPSTQNPTGTTSTSGPTSFSSSAPSTSARATSFSSSAPSTSGPTSFTSSAPSTSGPTSFSSSAPSTSGPTSFSSSAPSTSGPTSFTSSVPGVCTQNSLRLVGGTTPFEGRVEVCDDGVWGTVCDDSWDAQDAMVVCRQLGYSIQGAEAIQQAFFGEGTGRIIFDEVGCTGSESILASCPLSRTHNCVHSEDAGVRCLPRCTQNSLRLVGGTTPFEGRVEVCDNGVWGTVCDDDWDAQDAMVVCRQLGYSIQGAEAIQQAFFGQGTGRIIFDDVGCTGSESTLASCPLSRTHNCAHSEDAGVRCQPGTSTSGPTSFSSSAPSTSGPTSFTSSAPSTSGPTSFTSSAPSTSGPTSFSSSVPTSLGTPASTTSVPGVCTQNSLRLVGGTTPFEGRVEVCDNGVWGTVCDDDWDAQDAMVVCRQLGYSIQGAEAIQRAFFGQGTGRIIFDDVRCTGSESILASCPLSRTHNCGHSEDAGVRCQGTTSFPTSFTSSVPTSLGTPASTTSVPGVCTQNSLRLVGGTTPFEGRVEVCDNGVWGTVCDDDWDAQDAMVVCRQLGYSIQGAEAIQRAFFGQGTGRIIFDDVRCTGSESILASCPLSRTHNCGHSEDAGVRCQGTTSFPTSFTSSVPTSLGTPASTTSVPGVCSQNSLRLVGGTTPFEGRVEVCVGGTWGTVCDDDWDTSDASVVCRQLGFPSGAAEAFGNAMFGEGSGEIVFDDVMCAGNEIALTTCPLSRIHNCVHSEDAGVRCQATTSFPTSFPSPAPVINVSVPLPEFFLPINGSSIGPTMDDISVGPIFLGNFPFFGANESVIYVNDNGVLSFGRPFTSCCEPRTFPTRNSPPLVAPFWHDVNVQNGGSISYRLTSDPELLSQVSLFLTQTTGDDTFFPTQIFFATWYNVPPISQSNIEERNTFQVILATDGSRSYAGFLYGDIEWGRRARIGFNAGNNRLESVSLPVSITDGTLNISSLSNIGLPGAFVFRIDDLVGTDPEPPPPPCSEGSVRAARQYFGTNPSNITVLPEVCINGTYGAICDSGWDDRDARVACRQLGYAPPFYNTRAVPNRFTNYTGSFAISNVDCTGNETFSLNCNGSLDIGVECSGPSQAAVAECSFNGTFQTSGPVCSDGNLRLQNSSFSSSGVVVGLIEVCVNGSYGGICDIGWDDRDATVACNLLGFRGGQAVYGRFPFYSGRFVIKNVSCSGNETFSLACPVSTDIGTECSRVSAAGVQCFFSGTTLPTSTPIFNVSVPLPEFFLPINGSSIGPTMDDSSVGPIFLGNFPFFGANESVIYVNDNGVLSFGRPFTSCCEPRTFPTRNSPPLVAPFWHDVNVQNGGSISYRLTSDPELLSQVSLFLTQTTGDDTFFPTQIFFATWYNVAPFSSSSSNIERNTFQVILATDGSRSYAGFLYGDIEWGRRARIGFNAGNNRLESVSLPVSITDRTLNISSLSNVGLPGAFIFRIDDLVGTDPEPPPPPCSEGSVRAAQQYFGTNSSNITVLPEICINGTFGAICDSGWDDRDARVACRHLGYAPPLYNARAVPNRFTNYTGSFVISNVDCTGNETFSLNCNGSLDIGAECSGPSQAAVAECSFNGTFQTPGPVCFDGNLRLQNSSFSSSDVVVGLIEVCVNGSYGGICDIGWDDRDATVACNLIGFRGGQAVYGRFPFYSGRFVIKNVSCLGNETFPLACPVSTDIGTECSRVSAAGVQCFFSGTTPTSFPTSTPSFNGTLPTIPPRCSDGSLRLYNESFTSSGRVTGVVEICFNGVFRGICNSGWDDRDARVACNQAGFGVLYNGGRAIYNLNYTGSFFLRDVSCNGDESSPLACGGIPVSGAECSGPFQAAGVECFRSGFTTPIPRCFEGSLRRGNEIFTQNGVIVLPEICINGTYGAICDSGWDDRDARVACRQLGFSFFNSARAVYRRFSNYTGPIVVRDVGCIGNETFSLNCGGSTDVDTECLSSFRAAGIECYNDASITTPVPRCSEGSLRRGNEIFTQNGVIVLPEICINGTYGAICDSGWDNRDARVACRQLGFSFFNSARAVYGRFSNYTGPIVVRDVGCIGNETFSLNCGGSTDVDTECFSSSRAAGVECFHNASITTPAPRCSEGSFRNNATILTSQGSIMILPEICINGTFGAICSRGWDDRDARVACNQLGFSFYNSARAVSSNRFNYTGPIIIRDVGCIGNETSPLDCGGSTDIDTECSSPSQAAVAECYFDPSITTSVPRCFEGSLRGGYVISTQNGIIALPEICINGTYGAICDSGWDDRDARVACRQLGFSFFNSARAVYRRFSNYTGPIVVRDVGCIGNETFSLNCGGSTDVDTECLSSFRAAGIECYNDASITTPVPRCSEGSLRRSNEIFTQNGVIVLPEICINGTYGAICDSGWDDRDARVACRQLGFSFFNSARAVYGRFSNYTGPIVVRDVGCIGNETFSLNCGGSTDVDTECFSSSRAAGVECFHNASITTPAPRCSEGSFRNNATILTSQGSIMILPEICINGTFGAICSRGWDDRDARVACNQLGFSFYNSARAVSSNRFNYTGPIIIRDVGCIGNETSPLDCGGSTDIDTECSSPSQAAVAECYFDPSITTSVPRCFEGSLRGGYVISTQNGIIALPEICINGTYGAICDSGWDDRDARVACRQLGFSFFNSARAVYRRFSNYTGPIVVRDVGCIGNETFSLNCGGSTDVDTECLSSFRAAGIECYNDASITTPVPRCSEGSLRRSNEIFTQNGVIVLPEICINGTYGAICDSGWDNRDARVACRQLGFSFFNSARAVYGRFSNYTGPIVVRDVGCIGNETFSLNCGGSTDVDTECFSSSRAAGVECFHNASITTPAPRCSEGSFRNNATIFTSQGSIMILPEICINGTFGAICSRGWDDRDARVACNQLGFSFYNSARAVSSNRFNYTGPIIIRDVGCIGNETSPLDRGGSTDIDTECSSPSQAAVAECYFDPSITTSVPRCFEGSLRGGYVISTQNGIIALPEICINGTYGAICDSGWDERDARVACNQLGFPASLGARARAVYGRFSNYTGPILVRDVNCLGNETFPLDCGGTSVNTTDCSSPSRVAGVECYFDGTTPTPFTPPTTPTFNGTFTTAPPPTGCVTGAVRQTVLSVNSTTTINGQRLESYVVTALVCINDSFRYVCDEGWSQREAQVLCSQGGYGPPSFVAEPLIGLDLSRFSMFGPVSYGVGNVTCNGSEFSLLQCPRSFAAPTCGRNGSSVAGAVCRQVVRPCSEGSIEVQNVTSIGYNYRAFTGRVAVCRNGTLRPVCSEGFGLNEARRICDFLSYRGPFYTAEVFEYPGWRGGINDGFDCAENDTSIHTCGRRSDSCADPTRIAGVRCTEVIGQCFNQGTFRLGNASFVGGPDSRFTIEGRLEVCNNFTYGSVCDANFNDLDAQAFCRNQFQGTGRAISGSAYGVTVPGIVLQRVDCNGTERSIFDCQRSSLGVITDNACRDNGRAVSINCTRECYDGDTRIVGGPNFYEGRVEICRGNVWGTICDEGWDDADANITCVGRRFVGGVAASYGPGTGPILYSGIRCNGSEYALGRCQNDSVIPSTCTHERDAGVRCNPGSLALNIIGQGSPNYGSRDFSLRCNGMQAPWNTSLQSYQWLTTNNTLLSNTNRIQVQLINTSFDGYLYIFNSSIQFGRLTVEDAGMYTCNVTVLLTYPDGPNNSTAIITNSTTYPLHIRVPTPFVFLNTTIPTIAGSPSISSCLVTTVEGLTPSQLNIQWYGFNGIPITPSLDPRLEVRPIRQLSPTLFTREIFIAQLMESDSGEYSCEASVNDQFVSSETGRATETFIVTPGPNITTTPGPNTTVTPAPNTTVTPGPNITTTPGPNTTVTPAPNTTVTPGPNITTTPGPNTTVTPAPNTTVTPGPNITTTPGPNTTVTPAPNTTVTPGPNITTTPGLNTTVTPAPNTTVTPGPNITTTPGLNTTVTPAPNTTVTPGPNVTTTPGPNITTTPGPNTTVTPAPNTTVTPGPNTTVTPAPNTTVTPAPNTTVTPATEPPQPERPRISPVDTMFTALVREIITFTFSISNTTRPPINRSDIRWFFTPLGSNQSEAITGRTMLRDDARLSFSPDLLSLSISNISISSAGTYSISVSNVAGEATGRVVLRVQASPQVSIRGGSIVLEDPNMFSAGTFYCTIFAIPSANVSWFFFNSSANETTPLINGSDISIMRHYTSNLEVMETLSISRVGLAYRGGMVRCRASNVHGTAMAGTIPLIAVRTTLSITPLSLMITEGEPLELLCRATASWPRPQIKWLHNSVLVVNSQRTIITDELNATDSGLYEGRSRLRIRSAIPSESGNYSCRADHLDQRLDEQLSAVAPQAAVVVVNNFDDCLAANNGQGSPCMNGGQCIDGDGRYFCRCLPRYSGDNCEIDNAPESVPVITSQPMPGFFNLLSRVTFNCQAEGVPTPVITWFFNGARLSVPQIPTYSFDVTPERRGTYSCTAANSRGSVTSQSAFIAIRNIVQFRVTITLPSRRLRQTSPDVQEVLRNFAGVPVGNTGATIYSATLLRMNQDNSLNVVFTLQEPESGDLPAGGALTSALSETIVSTVPGIQVAVIQRFDGCSLDESNPAYMWPESDLNPNVPVSLTCSCGRVNTSNINRQATRFCRGSFTTGASWEIANTSSCNFDLVTQRLCSASSNSTAVLDVIVSEADSATPTSVGVTSEVLKELTNSSNLGALGGRIVDAISSVTDLSAETIQQTKRENIPITNSILDSLDRLGENYPLDSVTNSVSFTTTSVQVTVKQVAATQFNGDTFSTSSGSLELPGTLLRGRQTGLNVRITTSVFVSDSLFTPRRLDNAIKTGAAIFSASVVGVSVTNLDDPVELSFSRSKFDEEKSNNPNSEVTPRCVFWDQALDEGFGGWSREGVNLVSSTDGPIRCESTHLSTFTILLEVTPVTTTSTTTSPVLALSIQAILYIGLAISIIAIVIIIITYLASRALRQQSSIIISLNFALIFVYIAYIISSLARFFLAQSLSVCALFSAVLQYFMLCYFCWTIAESSLLLYMSLKLKYEVSKKYFIVVSLLCWLVPLVIVAISLGGYQYFLNGAFCRPTGWPFIFGFVIMFCITFIFNLIMYTASIISIKCVTSIKSQEADKVEIKRHLFVVIVLAILFIIGWTFGLVGTDSTLPERIHIPAQYIFSIFITLHSIFTLVLHTIRSSDARDEWRRFWYFLTCNSSKYTPKKHTISTAGSSSGRYTYEGGVELASDTFQRAESPGTAEDAPLSPKLEEPTSAGVVENIYVTTSGSSEKMMIENEEVKVDLTSADNDDDTKATAL